MPTRTVSKLVTDAPLVRGISRICADRLICAVAELSAGTLRVYLIVEASASDDPVYDAYAKRRDGRRLTKAQTQWATTTAEAIAHAIR